MRRYPQARLVELAKKLHYVKKSKSHYFFSAVIFNKRLGRKQKHNLIFIKMDDDQLQMNDGAIDPSIIEDTLPEVDTDDSEDGLGDDPLGLKDDDDDNIPDWEKEGEEQF